MNLEPLLPEVLRQHLPAIDSLEPCFDKGGFKWVYRAVVRGRKEAIKVLTIQESLNPDREQDEAAFVQEQYARIHREIHAARQVRGARDRETRGN